MHWSARAAARTLVSRIPLPKPSFGAPGSRLEDSSRTERGHQPLHVTLQCPHATRGHDTQVPVTSSASAHDMTSAQVTGTGRQHPGATDRILPSAGAVGSAGAADDRTVNSAPSCREEDLRSRVRTQNLDAAGEAILEKGRKSARSSLSG